MRIGVDFGGVCCVKSNNYEGNQEYDLQTKIVIDMEDCLDSLLKLRSEGHTLVLISYCGKNRARTTRPVVEYLFDEVYFVRSRDFKKIVCRNRGIDIMIDDRKDILDTIEKETKCILFESWKKCIEIIHSTSVSTERELGVVDQKYLHA